MSGLLDGLKVLDLSLWQPGHTATQLLADLGADVLKVEPPGGDRMRELPDRFLNFNGHKRSLVLNLKDPKDREEFYRRLVDTDVVIEGYKPGIANRLGVDYDSLCAIHPALVYCSISGFGQNGPLSQAPGHDHNYQAYAGTFTPGADGAPPQGSGALIGDQGAGLAAAFSILAAVFCARNTGTGEHIDVSIADLLASWAAPMGDISGGTPNQQHTDAPGLSCYATRDNRFVVLGIFSEDHFWDRLCTLLNLAQFAGLTMEQRNRAPRAIKEALGQAIAAFDSATLVRKMETAGLPVAPVLSREEAMTHPHFTARGLFCADSRGRRRLAHPVRYRNHPARPPGPPPALDEH